MTLLGNKDSRRRYRRLVSRWTSARLRRFLAEPTTSDVKRTAKGIAWAELTARRQRRRPADKAAA